MKAKSKTRDAAKFVSRGKIGIPELEGYYFGHADERAGSRFNRVVEKLADYARIEYGMKIFVSLKCIKPIFRCVEFAVHHARIPFNVSR